MRITLKTTLSKEDQIILDSLQKAVTDALEKKLRLGQYTVMWRDGKPAMIGEDAPKVPKNRVS
ncbi:MAG: hypothetical protein E6Q59_03605 [Nitrosomonas sp.]|nr:hypothetical protein [Nitrosomonas sp.]OQW84997.1 MAG: hypothetical protein BVN30_02105 [Proteobacteria bacterium ST_bin16]TXI40384.1 MAG: hypothetical protein E6Q59_03605 [Nitrosomonas sp.]